jgi:hypothetical protein
VVDGTLSGVIGADTVTLTQSGLFATKNVGTGIAVTATNSLSGSAADNYIVIGPRGLTANITPAALTVSGTTANNKLYDGTTTATVVNGALSGVIGADTVTLTQSGLFATKNVGTGLAVTATNSLSGSAAGNYIVIGSTGLTANITPATLTYTAAPVSSLVGHTPSLSGTVSGFVPGDTLANAAAGSPTWTAAGNFSQPGRYAIDGGGITAANYTFLQATGNASALTLSAAAAPQPMLDAIAQLESDLLSAEEGVSVDTTTAFNGTVTLRVVSGGLKLPADALSTH